MVRSPLLRYRRRRSRFRAAVAVAAAVAAGLAAPLLAVVAATAPAAAAQEVVDLPELTGNRGQTQDHGRVDPEPRQRPRKGPGGYNGFSAHPMIDVGEECAPSPLWVKDVDKSSYELGCEEIEAMLANNKRFVGEGRVRRVYLAEYGDQTVAVKVLQHQDQVNRHRIEVATMDAVRGNPHIVQTLGICNTTVVTEAFPLTLSSAMRKRTTALPIGEAVTMSLDAVRGLQALHEAIGGPIVHFDLKPPQILVTDIAQVKLNDFNVAWFMSRGPGGKPCPFNMGIEHRGQTSPWRSPEYHARKADDDGELRRRCDDEDNPESMTEKVDIYSMGLIFLLIIAGDGMRMPVAQESKDDVPVFATPWHRSYYEITQDMIVEEANRRPSARQVAERLDVILHELP